MFSNNPINDLHHALAHAQYKGFPELEYEDRDWELYYKTKEDKRVKKTRLHNSHDITVFAMFTQGWSSTALGFGGIGGAAMTSAYVIVLESEQGKGFCVYFGGRFAYHIQKPNDNFFGDVINRGMADVKMLTNDTKQTWTKRFDLLTIHERQMMVGWCHDNLYHGGYYEPNWWVKGNTFYFSDEREYAWFMLRWS